MYWRRFNLTGEPFSLTPDPAFLFLSSVHAEAFAALKVGLKERRGLVTMVGEVGTGKTTLVYSLLSSLGPEVHTAYISNPRISFDSMLRNAMRDFNAKFKAKNSASLLNAFNEFLQRCAQDNTTAALVIDEAQHLSRETFEDLRLLSNFETYKHKLLQIILVGQPELDTKLRNPALRQVAERVAVRCNVNPLTAQESRQYIEHRLASVGGSTKIFSESALRLIIRHSRGIPRTINILCHNAMLFAFGVGKARVTRAMAVEAIAEKQGRGLVRLRSPLAGWLPRSGRHHRPAAANHYGTAMIAGVATAAVLAGFLISRPSRESRSDAPNAAIGTAVVAPRVATAHHRRERLNRPRAFDVLGELRAEAWAEARLSEAGVETRMDPSVQEPPAVPPTTAMPEPLEPRLTTTIQEPPAVQLPAAIQKPIGAPLATARQEPLAVQPAPAPQVTLQSSAGTDSAALIPATAEVETPRALDSEVPATQLPAEGTAVTVESEPSYDTLTVKIEQGSSLSGLMVSLYGRYNTDLIGLVKDLNPHIADPNLILAGDTLRFPTSRGTVGLSDEESQ